VVLAGLAEVLAAAGLGAPAAALRDYTTVKVMRAFFDLLIFINEVRIFFWGWAGALADLRARLRARL
jgi:hypothetical protein